MENWSPHDEIKMEVSKGPKTFGETRRMSKVRYAELIVRRELYERLEMHVVMFGEETRK